MTEWIAIIKKTIQMALVFMLFGQSAVAHSAQTSDDHLFNFGISARAFSGINENDAKAALKTWAETVIREHHLDIEYNISMINGSESELPNKYHIIFGSIEDIIALEPKPDNVFLLSYQDGFTISYAIVVRNDSNITNWNDLAHHNIVVGGKDQILLAEPWLKTVLAKNDLDMKAPVIGRNASKAIFQVFFRQTDAALVTAEAFDLACELNPQMRKDLKVLYTSQPFIHLALIFLPGHYEATWKQNAEILEKAILALHQTPGGQQVLTVFKSSHIEKHPFSVMDSTINFILEYRKLSGGIRSNGKQP